MNKTKTVLLLTVVISLIFCLSSCNANVPYVSALQIADVTSADIVPIESVSYTHLLIILFSVKTFYDGKGNREHIADI